ncbi:HAD family hydrolase [Rossellomorea vietnamensis]|nr:MULTISPECIES: HAD family hydrolase [Rossellomorea]
MNAILFDLDRTLHDRDASVLQFLKAQHRYLNELQHSAIPYTYIDRFIELECRGYVWKDKVYSTLAQEFSLPLTPEELLLEYVAGFHLHCQEIDEASALLDFLKTKGYKIGMVTNGMSDIQNKTIDSLGIRSYFDTIIISEEAGIKKPDPAIFNMAAEVLGTAPSECLYIGDHYENDILAAQKAGMKAAWLTEDESAVSEHVADLKISSLGELKGYLTTYTL